MSVAPAIPSVEGVQQVTEPGAYAYAIPEDRGGTLVPPTAPQADPEKVRYWLNEIRGRKGAEDWKKWEETKKRAKSFYKGDLIDQIDRDEWQDDTVEFNMWRRILVYFVDAIYSAFGNIAVRPQEGRTSADSLEQAFALEAFLKYVWNETKQRVEAKRTLKDAYFGNVAASKTDYDRARGLWRQRWCSGPLIVDGQAHGDICRAMWVAEEVRLPKRRVLADDTFSVEVRRILMQKWGMDVANTQNAHSGKNPGEGLTTLYYVYSREGANPLSILSELKGEPVQEQAKKVLLVICEDCADYVLLEEPEPCPYLDEDEFPFPLLILDEMPGEWFGSPVWEMLESPINFINWLLTYFRTTAKKAAQTPILANKEAFAGTKTTPQSIVSGANLEIHEVSGDPSKALFPVTLTTADVAAMQKAEAVLNWLDRMSGVNEVARGESSGRKTAEEFRGLQQNTALVTKGPAQSLDAYLEESVRQVALASIYYIPAFSRVIGPDGVVMTSMSQKVPVMGMDPMTGMPMPQLGPDGQPMLERQVVPIPAPADEAISLGAMEFTLPFTEQSFGLRMPDTQVEMTAEGVPLFTHPSPGKVLRRGIDHYVGVEIAKKWPTMPLEDVKRDLVFSFEAGSTHAAYRFDQMQAGMGVINLLGPLLEKYGFASQLYDAFLSYTKALPLSEAMRFLPPREEFVSVVKQAAAFAQAQAAAQQQGPPGKGGNKQEAPQQAQAA